MHRRCTYLNLAVLFRRTPQPLGIVAIDGVPINFNGSPAPEVNAVNHIGIPPGARAEFIVKGPPLGVPALLVTRSVDTGPGGENDPNRAMARIAASQDAPEPRSKFTASPQSLPATGVPWLGDIAPVRIRRLYFSEKPVDPDNPSGKMDFYITVDGQTPVTFDPKSALPNIVAEQG